MGDVVAIARQILPPEITIQIPPNLVQTPQHLHACLAAGARDLGGLVPHDHVNPDYSHTSLQEMSKNLDSKMWVLQPRLPVYPAFDGWLPEALQKSVQDWRERLNEGYTDPIAAVVQQP
jgi:7,8-didemethyl-8-hydroxy-5-deazariboflavin synthase